MIEKAQQARPLAAGCLLASNTIAKGQMPDAMDACHFKQLAKAGAGKASDSDRHVTENLGLDLLDQTLGNNFDANSNSNAAHSILMPFALTAFTKAGTAEKTEALVTGHIKIEAQSDLSAEAVITCGLSTSRAAIDAIDGFAGSPEISPIRQAAITKAEPQNVQLNADPNTGLKHSVFQTRMTTNPTQVGTKPGFEGPSGPPAKALPETAQLVQVPMVQTPVATLQFVTRIDSLPAVTHIQIEQIKRNSAAVLTSLELVLEPAELGRITARLQHEDGRVTLVLNAANSDIADDLARDSGMLLRVLGEHIQNVDQMTVHIKTDANTFASARSQTLSDFSTAHQGQKGESQQTPGQRSDLSDVVDRVVLDTHLATPSRIFV